MKKRVCVAWAVIMVFAAVFVSGCNKAMLSVSPAGEIMFSGDGRAMTVNGTKADPTFMVTCQGAWTATSDKGWAKVDLKGDSFTISVEKNGEEQARGPAVVTVFAQGMEPVQIQVHQDALLVGAQLERAAAILGRGYDVTDLYAHSPSVKQAVLSFPLLVEDNMVDRDPDYVRGEFFSSYGNSSQEFSESLAKAASIEASLDVKGIVAFQAELSSNYKKDQYAKDSYAFAVMRSRIGKDAYFLKERSQPHQLSKYLSKEFKNDLRTSSPDQIIVKYGTHVMLGGVWGARLDHHFAAKKKATGYAESAGTIFEAKARGSYYGVTGDLSAKAGQTKDYSRYYETSGGTTKTVLYGGKAEYGQMIVENLDYKAWVDSIDGNIVWVDYYPGSLKPIYMFAQTDAQRDALEKSYNAYLAKKNITVQSGLKTKIVGGAFNCIGGAKGQKDSKDKTVYTYKGGRTAWTLKVSLTKGLNDYGDATIVPYFTYEVKEMQGREAVLLIEKPGKAITVGKDFTFMSEPSHSSGEQIVDGKRYGFFNPKLPQTNPLAQCMNVEKLRISIDTKDADDRNAIGVNGEWSITVGYVE